MRIHKRQHNPPIEENEQAAEWLRCQASPIYFIGAYCWVFNATENDWIPFDLWPAQAWALNQMAQNPLVVVLKARQLGFTWLSLGFGLWLMLFHASAVIGIFSKKEEDSKELLDFRLKGMYERLPDFMKCESVEEDNKLRWVLSNGSIALAFPTTGGRGYTFSYALVDEADFQPDLDGLMRAVKPTIDAGGRMTLLSTSDKGRPASLFKQIYRAASRKANEWLAIFLPWKARPSRSAAWYEALVRDSLNNTGSLDDVQQEYPATAAEALSPRSLDKRIPAEWLQKCYVEMFPLASVDGAPALDGVEIYRLPEPGERYVVGGDPAEGNPTSDDSALCVMNRRTGEEVAALAGKFQPSVFASHISTLGQWFNHADILVERNNHGHAVLLWLLDHAPLRILEGYDEKPGWLSTSLGKTLLYDNLAETVKGQGLTIHSELSYYQIASIEGATLRAPEGEHDDRADATALADIARVYSLVADERLGNRHQTHEEEVSISPV